LSELLWTCQQQFKTLDFNKFAKRIFLFTNEEDPMEGFPIQRKETIERAKSLTDEEDIDIELFPMPIPDLDKPIFDVTKFYSEILTVDEDELNELKDFETSYFRVQDLNKRIRLKEFKKRVLGKCLFSVTSKIKIGLKFYNLTKQTKKPTARFINKENGKEVKSMTKYTCKETNQSLYRSQIGTHFPVKNKKVMISKNDMKKIKHFEDSGMKLLGFKSKSSIKTYHNIRPSYFIYPDEKVIKGSSQMSHAMIKSLIKKEKVALVRFVPREGAMVRFCAIVPQDEYPNNELYGGQHTPPGFNLVFLPYSEDIRNIEEHLAHKEKLEQPTKEESRAAKLFVKNLSIDFNSRNFENPSIQKFYSALQEFALNGDKDSEKIQEAIQRMQESFQDTLEPDYEGMGKMKEVINKLRNTFDLGVLPKITVSKPKGGKRSRFVEFTHQSEKMKNLKKVI
jgi:ATP-dependent DNA helicase 2 subunit 1